MIIKEVRTLSLQQLDDLLSLMKELTTDAVVTPELLQRTVTEHNSHFFAALSDENRIVGCATLCVYDSPTGRKASVEDVVVSSECRGQGLGKALMEHLIAYARKELGDVDLHLTSRPHRVAANELYQKLGFTKKETNVYVMKLIKEVPQ